MSSKHSTASAVPSKPAKPTEDFPLFPHATGRWAKKIKGKLHYFGKWDDPQAALRQYHDFLKGKVVKKTTLPRPPKPSPDFPLFAHGTNRWAKKIRGRIHYFGPWDDPDGALARYNEQKEALHAGRQPRPEPELPVVKDLANAYLAYKEALLNNGELSPRTWQEYCEVAGVMVAHFGKHRLVSDLIPDDFSTLRDKLTKNCGPVRLGNTIQVIRSIFKHGFDAGLTLVPVRFGPGFARPSKKVLRLERAKKGPQMFEADELRSIIDAAGVPLRAMVLLGVNCGFGNADCGRLPLSALDLEGGWVTYPRPKTGIARRAKLWPETVEALQGALAKRPEPKNEADADLVFVTKYRGTWHKGSSDQPLTKEVRKLLNALGIGGQRNFYCLRHTFETIGGEAKDQVAVDHVMGHAREDMASVYRERISDARLEAAANHVHDWLFAQPEAAAEPSEPAILPFKAAK